MTTSNKIPEEVQRIYDDWNWYRRVWWFQHYLIGLLGLVFSCTVASKPQVLHDIPLLLNSFAWLSALCVGLLVFLEPRKRARAYTAAWRLLHTAIGKFRHDRNQVAPDVLVDAITQGEEFIARLDG